jgi:type VI secretion system protein ImpG
MSTIFNRFYNSELARLRTLSVEFAKSNPNIAPMLGAESTDPDVERILEGVAFLNGLTLQKLDDEFPEIAQEFASLLVPQILRPLPAATMIAFTPKVPLVEVAHIAAGTELGSVAIDGLTCIFRTTASIDALPVRVKFAQLIAATDGSETISIGLQGNIFIGTVLTKNNLRFYLGDEQAAAADLFYLLQKDQIESIHLSDLSGQYVSLSTQLLFPGLDEALIPYPDNAFSGFRPVQELLFFPQKFYFVEFSDLIKGADKLKGDNFLIQIRLKKANLPIPEISATSFQLNVVPAINLFKHSAEPIHVNHQTAEYLVLAEGYDLNQFQIYSIDSVIGFKQGDSEHKTYVPFALLNFANHDGQSSYRISVRNSPVNDRIESYLSIVYSPNDALTNETLSINLSCTNRSLPESLKLGDINRPTSSSPDRFTFQNIKPITGAIDPPRGEALLWNVVSHSALNFLSLGDVDTLRSMLRNYNFKRNQDHSSVSANERLIEGITNLKVTRENRLFKGMMLQGQHIVMSCQGQNWPSLGSLHLWGTVLDVFLASYAGINSYTRFEILDENTGIVLKWPMRLGQQQLL